MKFERIIFGIGVLIGLLLIRQTKPILLKIILIGLALSVGLSFLSDYININIFFSASVHSPLYSQFGVFLKANGQA
tara:strand:- start:2252 stop:2479 length:228 start_codon:yes stop_codon:yes gene_type:complete